jgi:hypothetical protein
MRRFLFIIRGRATNVSLWARGCLQMTTVLAAFHGLAAEKEHSYFIAPRASDLAGLTGVRAWSLLETYLARGQIAPAVAFLRAARPLLPGEQFGRLESDDVDILVCFRLKCTSIDIVW